MSGMTEVKTEALVIGDLDTAEAVEMLGSEKIYRNFLKKYYRVIETKSETIRNAYESENWVDFTREVHSLKSSSRQIGAKKLGDKAEKLEHAGKDNDLDYIRDNTEELLELYLSYGEVFKAFFLEEEEKEAAKPLISEELLKELMQKARAAADELDMDAMEEIAGVLDKHSHPEKHSEVIKMLRRAIEYFDTDECVRLSGEILMSIEE